MKVSYRPGEPSDDPALYEVFLTSFLDLESRLAPSSSGGDATHPSYIGWDRLRPLFEHLSATAAATWVAEAEGRVSGYARTILRDGVLQLTEFFVLPQSQSLGVGRELLERSFAASPAARRIVVGTPDVRAVARYLKAGLHLQTPCLAFRRQAERCQRETDLTIRELDADRDAGHLAAIDRAVLGYERAPDHRWLGQDRLGWLFLRGGTPVGYAYAGQESGPAAMLDDGDVPAALAVLETAQADDGREFMVRVPALNTGAVGHLLDRSCTLDPLFAYLFSDAPIPQLDRYVLTVPEFPL